MANCAQCGRQLPSFSFGEVSNLCPECKQAALSSSLANAPASLRRAPYRPPFTVAIVGLNVLVFAGMLITGASLMEPNNQQLLKWGADFGPLSLDGQPWRILTSNYVHVGILHIFFNMWCLWNLGRMSERIFGGFTYLLIYTTCGIAGSLISLWAHPITVGAGASGAIFGLAGALITALYLGKLPYPGRALRGMMRSLITFAGYNLLFGAAIPGIDNSAHVGGLVMGLGLGAVLGPQLTEPPEKRKLHEWLTFVAAVILLVGLGATVKRQNGYVVIFGNSKSLSRSQLDQAIVKLEHAVAQRPNDKLALSFLGSAYLQKQDYSHAETTLKHLLTLRPDDPTAQYNLAVTYIDTGRTGEALPILLAYTDQNPSDDNGWALLASALNGLGHEDEAIHVALKAIALNPQNPDAYLQLGRGHLKMNETDAAIYSFKKAAELDPKSAEIQRDLGQAYTLAGQTANGSDAIKKAEALEKESP